MKNDVIIRGINNVKGENLREMLVKLALKLEMNIEYRGSPCSSYSSATSATGQG